MRRLFLSRREIRAILWLCAALLYSVGFGPRSAHAAPRAKASSAKKQASAAPKPNAQCIHSAAVRRFEGCPSGARQKLVKASGRAPQSRLREAKPKSKKKTKKTGPSIELDMATRRNQAKIRARAYSLLQREVRVLSRLVSNTPQDDARRPDILLRQAETQFEMQQALNNKVRSYDEPIYKQRRRRNAAGVRRLRNQQKKAESELQRVRKQTIQTYAILVRDHSDYGKMDQVLFSLAFALEELKQFDRARQVYHRLIKGYKDSPYIPHAYLSFAEYFFNRSDMNAALQFYQKVTEYPEEKNPVYGYALYKAAWAYYNVDDFKGSLRKFVEVIEHATRNPQARDVKNLARQARREMVMPYARVGSPKQSLTFFRRYAKNNAQALEMVESLADLYYDEGKWDESIETFHLLMAEAPDADRLCYWQTRVTNAVVSAKGKSDQVVELKRLVDVYTAFIKRKAGKKKVIRQCQQETATILVWLATSWHRETVGSKEQPGTNDKKTMRMASQLYELLLKKFPDLEKMKFPTIDRRDWPTRYRIAYYHAELLWKMGDWVQCGPAFDKVVELNPKGEYTSDAAYAAVLCYNNLYQQQYQGTETQTLSARKEDKKRGRRGRAQEKEEEPSYASRPFTKVEKGMLNAFRRYICYVQNSDELPTVKYRRARIYYEANRFEEAALMFQDIAWNHRDSDLAEYAANLYLDSLNVLGTKLKMPRPACVGEIANALEPLSKFYCASSEAAEEHADLCKVVGQLRCDVMRTQAESYTKAGEHKKAAATYVKVFRKYRECGKLDEVLYNAAISFEAARLLGRAIQVRNVLIQQYPKSSLSKKALFLIGANFHALAYYDRAAQYYEQFATKYPRENGAECTEEDKKNNTCAVAHEALMNAVFFRLGLGQDEKAIEDARLFEANYRRTLPAQTSQVVFSLGSIHKKRKTWYKLVEHYRDYLKSYRRRAMPHQVIQANVESGKAFWVRSDKRRAEEYFRKAVGAWRGGAEKAINGMDLPASEKALHLYEAKEATSEALFYLAEYKYAEFLRVRFPRYSKGRSLAQVNAWAKSKFKPWVERKRKALVAAEKEYNEIAKLKVPAWEIAAAARVGEMYRSFVDEFRDAPVPKEIESDPELFDIYVGALDEQSEPLQKVAIDKFEFCLITSTRVRWFNRWSRQCELELNKLSPQNYPLAAELRGDAQHEKDTLAQPGKAELGRESESLLGPRAASEPEQATALQGGRS